MAFAIIDDMVESADVIFVLYILYSPQPIAANDAKSTRYVATARFCNAGIAAGVIIKLLFFVYAKNDAAIAKKPTSISARYDLLTLFCFSTCKKFLP